ncbi:MAG: hypothetical protein L6407_09820 [Candidatus Delongbacteria bacterium]|nr:hypothetical protein [Candidatus Delongbacteria bacterium]
MEIIGYISGVFAIFAGVFGFYYKFIKPHFLKSKLIRFYFLVQEWFDYIDKSDIENIKVFELNNIENKVSDYIKDHKIKDHFMKFSMRYKKIFLKSFSYDKNDIDEEFKRYSRLPADGIHVEILWNLLVGAFSSYSSAYKSGSKKFNYADIEMRVKALKMYLGIKQD